jgi:predicted small lipoprotein YifL
MHLLIAAAVAGTFLGCGQKGPLVQPDAQHPHKKIGVSKPPAASVPSGGTPPSSSASPSGRTPPADAPGPAPQP